MKKGLASPFLIWFDYSMETLLGVSAHYIESLNRKYVRDFLKEDPFRTHLTILLGQRGVGKTTVIVQYIASKFRSKAKKRKALYLPADHMELGGRSLYEIAKEFNSMGGELICFDEIHKYDNWSQELKSICDTFPNLKVIASGSSALEVHKGSHDLSRRAIVRYMPGLSFREYLSLKVDIKFKAYEFKEIVGESDKLCDYVNKKISGDGKKVLDLFGEYLRKGYYPYFIDYSNDDDFYAAVEQTVYSTLEGDIPSVHPNITGGSIKKMRKLLSIIARQVPFQPSLNKLTSALEVQNIKTLKKYIKYLEDAGLINTLSKSGKRLATLGKPDKIYLNNTNQSYALGQSGTDIGTVRETFFLNAVSRELEVTYPTVGDFNVEGIIFEVGGRSKTFDQISHLKNAYLAIDGIEEGWENVIPLWLFGFLY